MSLSTRFSVDGQNLGLNKTSPQYALDVSGALQTTQGIYSAIPAPLAGQIGETKINKVTQAISIPSDPTFTTVFNLLLEPGTWILSPAICISGNSTITTSVTFTLRLTAGQTHLESYTNSLSILATTQITPNEYITLISLPTVTVQPTTPTVYQYFISVESTPGVSFSIPTENLLANIPATRLYATRIA